PNPFKDQFTLSHGLSTEGTIRIRITDLSGRTYLDRTVENSENQLIEFSGSEISSMIRGLYIVSVTDGIKTEVHRIKKD
ncbi:MAG: T9SS type A sorting domain-containing protein, partial [Bacteroidota bacterium]